MSRKERVFKKYGTIGALVLEELGRQGFRGNLHQVSAELGKVLAGDSQSEFTSSVLKKDSAKLQALVETILPEPNAKTPQISPKNGKTRPYRPSLSIAIS